MNAVITLSSVCVWGRSHVEADNSEGELPTPCFQQGENSDTLWFSEMKPILTDLIFSIPTQHT